MRVTDNWEGDEATDIGPTMEVVSSGFQQPAGFVQLKETSMPREMTEAEIARVRQSVAIKEVLPTIDAQVDKMIKTTQTKVFAKIRDGALTPEEAMSYWMEVYAYARLNTRMTEEANYADTRR